MLFVYYLSDGAIYRASIPEKNLEDFFGKRAEEMSKVFGAIYVNDYDPYVFSNFFRYKVNLETNQLELVNKPIYLV